MSAKIEFIPSGGITSVKGFQAGATCAGIKKGGDNVLDLGIIFSEVPSKAAALFTSNQIKAAPVILSQERIKRGIARAIVVNSGCANACTGEQGLKDAEITTELVARKLGVQPEEVLIASTGVIGVNLPMQKMKDGIRRIILSNEGGHELTRAIMTTDTRPKEIAIKVQAEDIEFTVGGTAKGSGMIHPNLATMLCFLTTDASVADEFLKLALEKSVGSSFNMVSVDGDTSTNDTVFLLANSVAGNKTISKGTEQAGYFQKALDEVCLYLAKCIARDGEGATKLIEVKVNGALDSADARVAARTIVTSPLVKTAVNGCDPNWGRILAAAGRSGAKLIASKTDVYIGDKCLLKSGTPLAFDKKEVVSMLKREEVFIRLELNIGTACAVAWGCDLSKDYVSINAEYTT